MPGDGPFLWFRPKASDRGFRSIPEAGFCISVFPILHRDGKLLVDRYAEHPAWMELAGLDPDRVQRYARGWTVPGTHLAMGEDPSEGGRRIVEDVLGLDPDGIPLSDPRVTTSYGPHPNFADLGDHFDLWFFLDGRVPPGIDLEEPAWYDELRWVDTDRVQDLHWARCHGEVVEAALYSGLS